VLKVSLFCGLAFFGLFASVARGEDAKSDLAAAVAVAAAKPAEWVPAVTTKVTWKSQYVTGNGYANGPALQEDCYLSWSNVYLDFWHSGGSYRKFDSSFADEIDYTVGLTGKLFGGEVDFDLAAAYFDLYQLGDGHGDMVDPSLTLSKSFDIGSGSSLTPTLKVENAILLDDWDSWWIFTGGVTHSVNLGWQGASLSNTAKVVYDNGAKASDGGMIFRWRVGLDVPLCEDGSATLGLGYERYWISGSLQDREDVGSVDVSLAIKF
jgi:hypothetical protein